MRVVDDHHATLNFASDRLAAHRRRQLDAKITFVNGARVSGLEGRRHARQRHQVLRDRLVLEAAEAAPEVHVKFRLGNAKTVERFVKLFNPGEHG